MQAPAFWWRSPGFEAALLQPLAALYGSIAASRLNRSGVRTPVPVICVGNPTLGGAGKTPTALALAALLVEAGERPVFLSRGYGGRLEGPHLVEFADAAAAVGDEPLLLARAAPTVIARDRTAGATLAATLGSVVVMDDGFQNPALEKDLSFLVIDGVVGLGNGRVFPAGPLRAPLKPQLAKADALIVVGDGKAGEEIANASALPVLRAQLKPKPDALAGLGPLVAFAGIGRPEKFEASLVALGHKPARFFPFPDHHRYSDADAAALERAASEIGGTLITTEKDLARLRGEGDALAALAARTRVLPVAMEFERPNEVRALLGSALARKS